MRIKAISPDNQREITQLAALFRAVFGPSYPIKRVYDPTYWTGHIGAHFTSLAAIDDGIVVGHISLQPDLHDPKLVHLGYPLIHPLYVSRMREMGSAAMKVIRSIASRQQWSALSFVEFPHIPEMSRFGRNVLGTVPVAVLKGYFPAQSARLRGSRMSREARRELAEFRRDIVVTQCAIGPREIDRPLSIPEQYADSALDLCVRAGVHPIAGAAENSAAIPALPADRAAIEPEYFPQSGVIHLLVEPTLAGTPQEVLTKLESYDAVSQHVFLNALDSRTPEFFPYLLDRGFSYSGMVPYYRGRVNVVLSRSTLASLQIENRVDDAMRDLFRQIGADESAAVAARNVEESHHRKGARGTRRHS